MLNLHTTNNYSLSNIAGYEEEKAEAMKIINLLKNYEKLKSLGVYTPKGLILSGHPGVGKTLMAKVIATESKVPFYEYEASEDDTPQKLIANLKNLYEVARQNAPSIILIDELDELVSSDEFVSDFSRIMLKGLLTEIDGVKNSDGVLTIATTNYYNRLPSALVRSGRMDKHISFDLPDYNARKEIIRYYTQDKNIISNIDLDEISSKTSSFTPADLKTLVNETIIDVINSGRDHVENKDFCNVVPLVMFKGIAKNNTDDSDHICYHELGHFICEYVLNNNLSEISIEKIGNVGGHVRTISTGAVFSDCSYEECKNIAITLLGGYAAEKIFMGQTYTGVVGDLNRFANHIENMAICGMFGSNYMFREQTIRYAMTSSNPAKTEICSKCFDEYLLIAEKIINDNKNLILFLFDYLKEQKKLDSKYIESLIDKFNSQQ